MSCAAMTRLVLLGKSSFIARHTAASAARSGTRVLALPHGANAGAAIQPDDVLVNFAFEPSQRHDPYDAARDMDLAAARLAAAARVHFVMLSSRRVYPAAVRWGARETAPAGGDETVYGRNKAHAEDAVLAATGGRATILRMANIIGFEYDPAGRRKTFMSRLLNDLRVKHVVEFDMHPDTQRDFLPISDAADSVFRAAGARREGVFNVGSGFPVRCADIAEWIMRGFGQGRLSVKDENLSDQFYLNTEKWVSAFGPTSGRQQLTDFCIELGRKLRHA